jgi:hypothetical protein
LKVCPPPAQMPCRAIPTRPVPPVTRIFIYRERPAHPPNFKPRLCIGLRMNGVPKNDMGTIILDRSSDILGECTFWYSPSGVLPRDACLERYLKDGVWVAAREGSIVVFYTEAWARPLHPCWTDKEVVSYTPIPGLMGGECYLLRIRVPIRFIERGT